jgi:hypothetical protein
MKNNQIIQIAAMVIIAAALIYRKYFKQKKTGGQSEGRLPGKSLFSSHSSDDDYEPYSKKETNK